MLATDADLTRLDEPASPGCGIGRKFQRRPCSSLLSLDDLCCRWPATAVRVSRCGRRDAAGSARLDEMLATIRLGDDRDRRAADLSHGQKQWLEIGMLLAQEPKLLLVDEPVAGMTDAETAETADLLREINRTPQRRRRRARHGLCPRLGAEVTVLHEGVGPGRRLDRPYPEPTRASSKSISGGEPMLKVEGSIFITARAKRCAGSA